MKKFTFPLDKIKQFRQQEEETQKNLLGEMRAELNFLKTQRLELEKIIYQKNDDLRKLYAKGAYPTEIGTLNRFLSVKKAELAQKNLEIERKENEIAHQLEAVMEASREVQKLEKLEEHQLEEYKELERKEQEKFIEEFVTNSLNKSQ